MQPRKLSRRVVLASMLTGAVAACDSHPNDSKHTTTSAAPSSSGPAQLAPAASSYVKTYTVDASGAGGSYKTFTDAYAQVNNDLAALPVKLHPRRRILIRVAPGTHAGPATPPGSYIDIVGTGSPSKTIIDAHDANTLESTGRSIYVANLTLQFSGTRDDLHPWRDSGQDGSTLYQYGHQARTVIVENVILLSKTIGGGTDHTPGSNLHMVMKDVQFRSPSELQVLNISTNFSPLPKFSVPAHYFILNPTIEVNKVKKDRNAAPAGLIDRGCGVKDTVTWVGGTFDVGTANPVEKDIVLVFRQQKPEVGRATTFNIDPALKASVGGKGYSRGSGIGSDLSLAELPKNGVGSTEAAWYGLDRDQATSLGTPAGSQDISVPARTAYAIPLAITAPMNVTGAKLELAGGSASRVMLVASDAQGRPGSAIPGAPLTAPSDTTGKVTFTPFQAYPGMRTLWAIVCFDEAATVKGGAVSGASVINGYASAENLPVTQFTTNATTAPAIRLVGGEVAGL